MNRGIIYIHNERGLQMSNANSRWYYRLGNSECNEFLWTGAISSATKVTKAEVTRAICKQEGLKRLPARSVVVSQTQIATCKAAVGQVRDAMNGVTRSTPIAVKPKVFENVGDAPITVEDVQAMLKKFGLA
jgi:hypothetical protein